LKFIPASVKAAALALEEELIGTTGNQFEQDYVSAAWSASRNCSG
jgi:hypothetical protein